MSADKFTFAGTRSDKGFVFLGGRDGFDRVVSRYALGVPLMLTVEEAKDIRSLQANNYYWGVVVTAAVEATGQDADSVHAFWKDQFLPSERKQVEFFHHVTGIRIRATVEPTSTKRQSIGKFITYVEECREWLRNWYAVDTPDPDPEYWRKRAPKAKAA